MREELGGPFFSKKENRMLKNKIKETKKKNEFTSSSINTNNYA